MSKSLEQGKEFFNLERNVIEGMDTINEFKPNTQYWTDTLPWDAGDDNPDFTIYDKKEECSKQNNNCDDNSIVFDFI